MRLTTRLALFAVLSFALSGCSLVYTLPTRQGNVIEQTKLNQLKLGMTKTQVQYLLGTPIASSVFVKNRWDYLGYYRSPRGKVSRRLISLYFNEEGALQRMQGVHESNRSLVPSPAQKLPPLHNTGPKGVPSGQSPMPGPAQQSSGTPVEGSRSGTAS